MKTLMSLAVGVTLILATASTTSAQYRLGQADTGISGNGIVSLERDAEIMRMQIQLMATTNNLKEALAALQTRSDNAKQQVIALGADKASIKIQPAQIVKAANDRQQQIQMMMRQRMQQGGRKKETAKKAEPIQVAAMFTAEWKLSAKSHDELLTTTHQLQQKLKTLDLAGTKDAKKLSPEEQEALEEAQTEFGGYEDPNAEQPGQPTFLFVAEIPYCSLNTRSACNTPNRCCRRILFATTVSIV